MANIYEIKNEFNTLWSIIEDDTLPEEDVLDAFKTATEDLAEKFENCCKYIKNVEADIAGLKDEIDRLQAKKKAKENAIDRLKGLMQQALEASGDKKLPCGTFTVSIQNNPESVALDEQYVENFPVEYLKFKEPEVDKKKLKEDLKAGKDLGGLAHLVQTSSLRIR